MRLTRTDEYLQLHDQSGAMLVLGAAFVVVGGVLLWGALGGFSNAQVLSAGDRAITILIGGGTVIAGAGAGLGVRRLRVRLLRDRRELEIRERHVFAVTVRRITHGEVAALRVTEQANNEGDRIHGMVLVLRTGEELLLALPDATDLTTTAALARTVAREAGYPLELPTDVPPTLLD